MKGGAGDADSNAVTKSDLEDDVVPAADVEGGSGTGAAVAAKANDGKTEGECGDKKEKDKKKKAKKWPMNYTCTCGSYTPFPPADYPDFLAKNRGDLRSNIPSVQAAKLRDRRNLPASHLPLTPQLSPLLLSSAPRTFGRWQTFSFSHPPSQ